MNTISSNVLDAVNAATAASGTASGSSASGTSVQAIQDRFLTLLVTQLKNQDPLNPMDNAQMTTQLAQISTVTGISDLNKSVQNLLSSNMDTQTLQAAALMNRNVLASGTGMNLSQGVAKGGLEMSGNADSVLVAIKDAAGSTVTTMNLGALQSGIQTFSWDGTMDNGAKAPDGKYSISVLATQAGASVAATTLSVGTVSSVARAASGVSINLGNLGSVALADIKQIL